MGTKWKICASCNFLDFQLDQSKNLILQLVHQCIKLSLNLVWPCFGLVSEQVKTSTVSLIKTIVNKVIIHLFTCLRQVVSLPRKSAIGQTSASSSWIACSNQIHCQSSNREGSRSSSQKATTGRNTDRPSYINIKFSNYLNRSSCKLQNAIITVDYMLLDTTRERFIIRIKSYRIFQLPGSKLNISSIIVSLTQIYQIYNWLNNIF